MRIGIDVGGTKIEGVALRQDGREAARVRVATPPAYPALLQGVAAVVARLDQESGAAGTVGIGTPGFLQPGSGLIRNSNVTYLNDRPLDRDLTAAVGRPVRVANDAKCFVLSEATDGAGAPPPGLDRGRPDVVFGATLGTGVGGGLVVDGRVLTGENGSATEWSHTTLPFLRPDERSPYACPCGHPGCIESFISGRGLEGAYRQAGGEPLRGPDVARRAEAGEGPALEAFAVYEDRLARALASVINMVDPRAIVLGGGVSNNARLFANVPLLLERYTVAKDLGTRIVPAAHGDASGVRGAAWLWPQAEVEAH
ncbi:MAG: ROK family protein [Pseudomonadota bacterium]